MHQYTKNTSYHLRRDESVVCQGQYVRPGCRDRQPNRVCYTACLLLLTLATHPMLAQEKLPEPLKGIDADIAANREWTYIK